MRVLCISGSPRRGGNTDYCIDYLARHLAARPNTEVEICYLSERNIKPCQGCRACMREKRCVIDEDDFPALWEKVMAADLLLLAAPVYWMGPPGLMKNFIDRTHGVYALPLPLLGKSAFLVTVAADSGFEQTEIVMRSWVRHYGAKMLGKARVVAREIGDAEKSHKAHQALDLALRQLAK